MADTQAKSRGFTAVYLVAVLVALIVIGFLTGYIVWMHQNSSGSGTHHPSQNNGSSGNNQPQPTTPNPNEFTVTELGFKMILPDGIKDLKYTFTGSSAYFTTSSLEQLDGAGSQCTAANGAIGAISRLSQDPKTAGASYAASKAVGSFYLIYDTPPQGCSRNAATNQQQLSQARLLQQALDTATPTN